MKVALPDEPLLRGQNSMVFLIRRRFL